MLYCLPNFLINNLLLRLESSAAHAASGFTLYLKPKALPPGAQVGALGAPASEQAFDCPACSAALSSAQVFGQAALLQAACPRPAPEAGISAASGDDDGAEAAQAALGAAPSAKLQRLLALLADVRARNQATPTRLVPRRFPAAIMNRREQFGVLQSSNCCFQTSIVTVYHIQGAHAS